MSNRVASGRAHRLDGVAIRGVASVLPRREIDNQRFEAEFGEESVRDVVKMIGVRRRYWVEEGVTAADLCFQAADKLLARLSWDKSTVDALIFVSQTPDYRLPATACVLQGRLGLGTACAAFDVNLGCSGYTYGLWLASSLIKGGSRRVLLLAGDTISRTVSPSDRATAMLFGDAGTATAVEFDEHAGSSVFVLGTDGRGATNLMIPQGAYRKSEAHDERLEGRDPTCLFMDGGEIFNFTLRSVPPLTADTLSFAGRAIDDVDGFLYHQANEFMLKHLARKSKISAEKFHTNIDQYGNTSCASIPLLMTTNLSEQLAASRMTLLMAGFGVGYSWGSALMDVGPLSCNEIEFYDAV
ncbi:ketoacyl-ACP synthase III [Ralstonia insidiosa]|uniref:3-oxoacyl-ACP synthase n=1 Tax=Ralstonia insidiosa TaxID=190721 RepID=A0A191ZU45_9RALS|nr:ketoacyl-ACP synthase III [Ralstonia insidiosa]ANJ71602.1 3-oxoacyl-ACP synthase [Ralstonia insidiosa]KAB0472205.1 ketoacyl-ACP synthase III [Ralstonia insidiosa]MBY4908217.1 ketoacyl-ACP synthase III [Ralstonia insidiosa]